MRALDKVGMNGTDFIVGLEQKRAALNSTALLRQSSIGHTLGAVTRTTSPRRTTPLAAKVFNTLKGVADMNNFVAELTPLQRRALLEKPALLRVIQQTTMQAIQGANAGADALVMDALDQSQPQPTQMPMPQEKTK
jgi:hypothetical protein